MLNFRKSASSENEDRDGERRQQRGRTILIWIERILLVSGLVLVGVFAAARIESFFASRAALDRFAALETASQVTELGPEEDANATDELGSSEPMNLPDTDFHLWDERRVNAYKQNVGKQSGVPLALLGIPKIGLEVPLFEGTDEITLNHAVGRIAGTARPGEEGNIGIAGHRDGFFRGLKDVAVGDVVELKTLNGTDRYNIDRIQIVKPNQVDVLQPRNVPSLTLVTCYPFYFLGSAPQRYIVTASLSREINGGGGSLNSNSLPAARNSTRRKHMKNVSKSHFLTKGASTIALALVAFGTAWSQDSTVTTIQHGPSSYETQVKNAEVVYAEGNDLVLKLESGRVEHMIVPDSDRFTIDGKEVGVQELVPGTKLTQTITTSITPRYVNSVRTIEGKVWHVSAPKSVILSLPDNTNQVFNVPNHAKFTIDGREKTVFDLKKGMKIKATVVTDDEHTVIEQTKLAFGQAPPVATPREVGVLLFLAPSHPYPVLASAEQPADMLPETGSLLPLMGLLGTLAIAMSVGLWAVRRTRTI